MRPPSRLPSTSIATFLALVAATGCSSSTSKQSGGAGGSELADLMRARNLSEADVSAALKTYTPTGRHDDYYLFGSGGHSGQVIVVGLPSMRILKYIAVFTPEPW
jgi:nitrous-oxide reductase